MADDRQTPLRLRIGRALGRWLVPEGLRDAQRRLRKAMRARRLVSESGDLLARNAELRGKHAGRRCFVIGNGPSLARQDLAPLAGEITFAVNGYWKHPMVERWNPTYYAMVDPNFFDGSEPCRAFFSNLRARCPASTFVVPVESHPLMAGQDLLPAERIRYVAFNGQLADGFEGFPDLTSTVPAVMNVVLLQMMAAMYMGCTEIYLLGLDHDWLAHRGEDRHFHSGKTVENHPSAVYTNLSLVRYRLLMEAQLDLWKGYEAVAGIADACGTRIFNATDGGFLDVFPRVRYEDVIATKAPAAGGSGR